MENIGLVLEGGGSRTVFTCGILDYFLEMGIEFPYIVGVSAGATNALSYVSRQPGRNRKSQINWIQDPRYLSWRNWLKTGNLFGWDFIFKELPHNQLPFDFDTFYANPTQLLIGTTDVRTGEVVYFRKSDLSPEDLMEIAAATCRLPFVSTMAHFRNLRLLDGGIGDPIPIVQAQKDGYTKNVVILTQPPGYLKPPFEHPHVLRWRYRRYPAFIELMLRRHKIYNNTLHILEDLVKENTIFLFQPDHTLPIDRLDISPANLLKTYHLGRKLAQSQEANLITWIDAQ